MKFKLKCLSCNNSNFDKITVKNRNIYLCKECGLGQVSPLPSKKNIQKIINIISRSFYDEYRLEKESYNYYFDKKINDIQRFKKSGKLLDIGCGPGNFVELCNQCGFKGFGIDLSKRAVDIAKRKGLRVNRNYIEEINGEFDVITAFQLIEHLRDPDYFIKKVFKLLKINGIFSLTTPDRRGLPAIIFGKYYFDYYNNEHPYFFTVESLSKLLKRNGFKLLVLKRESSRSLGLYYLWNRLINYYYTEGTKPHMFIKRLEKLFVLLDKYIKLKIPHTNIYIIAIKI